MINAKFKLVLCIFVQRLNSKKCLKCIVADLQGEVLEEETKLCNEVDYGEIFSLVKQKTDKFTNIGIIGISIQGVVCVDGAIGVCDTKELEGINLVKRLMTSFDVCTICENDMNIITLGVSENEELSENGSAAVIARYKRVDSGAGIVIDGKVIRGSNNFAGEVSYLPLGGKADSIERTANEIACISAIINPNAIAIVGDEIAKADISAVCDKVEKIIPAPYCPQIIYIDEPYEFAKKGLLSLCLKKLNGEEV